MEKETRQLKFEDELIQAVYLRPFIYDKKHPRHAKRALVKAAWSEIATQMNVKEQVCRTRWRSLRDTFYKHYNAWRNQLSDLGAPDNQASNSWVWFKSLMFLSKNSKPNASLDNFGSKGSSLDGEGVVEAVYEVGEEVHNLVTLQPPGGESVILPEVDDGDASDVSAKLDRESADSHTSSREKRVAAWVDENTKQSKKAKTTLTSSEWCDILTKVRSIASLISPPAPAAPPIHPFALYLSHVLTSMPKPRQRVIEFEIMDVLRNHVLETTSQ